jgi:hypothetical protein
MEKHRAVEDLNKNTKLTDAKTVIDSLNINKKLYTDAIKTANSELASAHMNLEINEKALENLEEFLTIIDSSKNQLKYTSSSAIKSMDDLAVNLDSFIDTDEASYGSYESRSSLVLEPFREQAIAYEKIFSTQQKNLVKETDGIAAQIETFGGLVGGLLTTMQTLMGQMETLRKKKREKEETLLEIRKKGEVAIDAARKELEKKKIEIHQKVLDNKSVIENTNNIMKVYKSNLETDIRASYSEAGKKKIEEEENPIKQRGRLTVLKTLYDESLVNEEEYTDKKKEELEKEENLEIKKLKEK